MHCWLAERTAKTPDAIALVYGDRSWTFAALNEQASVIAARLDAAGVQPGDHIAALLPSRPEYVALVFAAMRLGCVLVPLNLRLTPDELGWQIGQAKCAALVCSAETMERAGEISRDGLRLIDLGGDGAPRDPSAWQTGREIAPDSIQAIIYTSGTTGKPKGAMITVTNHRGSASASQERLGHAAAARWLLCMPLYHVGGLSIILRCCLYGTTVILHDGFDVAAVSDAIDHDGVSMVSLVPTMLHRLIEHRAGRPFPATLRCILLGGAAASPKLVAQCIEQNIPIALTYGLTETCSQVATATPDEVRARPGTAGRPLPGTSVRILGEDGAELPAGEIGEIAVSGPTVMKGYLNGPEMTAAVVRDGWLHTRDLGYLDADGFLWPVQRRSDLIISGGENIYPAEVEAVLETHPAVREVCVVGLDDAEWGQRVAALVVADGSPLTAETLIAFCREHLAGYKCPRIIQFADALPRTASGKVIRAEVATMIAAPLDEVTPK